MPTKRARIITEQQQMEVIEFQSKRSRQPVRDRAMLGISFFAGARACEIARMNVNAFLDSNGEVGHFLHVFGDVGKKGRERTIPLHPVLREFLLEFREHYPHREFIAFRTRPCDYGQTRLSANSVAIWFHRVFSDFGLEGCSSHSGRRTFITLLAQRANWFHGSLRDVQLLAGHARLETTERYIDPTPNQAQLVASLGAELPSHVPLTPHDANYVPVRHKEMWQALPNPEVEPARPSRKMEKLLAPPSSAYETWRSMQQLNALAAVGQRTPRGARA